MDGSIVLRGTYVLPLLRFAETHQTPSDFYVSASIFLNGVNLPTDDYVLSTNQLTVLLTD